jgi:septum formation protein
VTRVILASASPARAAMLRDAGVEIEVVPARVDEEAIKEAFRAEGVAARDLADALAEAKARQVSAQSGDALVIGGDQVLVFDGRTFDKPKDRAEARAQLSAMRGASHELLSAAVIYEGGAPVWRHIGAARLTMRPFSDTFLDAYLDAEGDAVLSTVGGYRIEERGAQLFSRVGGDYFSILGMPLLEMLGFLRARKVLTE